MTQDVINVGIGLIGALMGWTLKVLWDSIRLLQEEMKSLQREVHTGYVAKDDWRQEIHEIKEMCKAIFDKLDKKVDK